MGSVRSWAASAATLALLLASVAPAAADFPDDPPDDPRFDRGEESFPTCNVAATEQQYGLFSFLPACAPLATDPEDASGMSVDAAWRDFSIGHPDVLIAYVEAGINWHEDGDAATGLDFHEKVHINAGELPEPTAANGYVDNGDPWFNALDWPDTPDHNDNGIVDAEDLIVEHSDGVDDDGNGYVDDISGWDFYGDQNDPAWGDTAYTHANAQMRRAAATTDNGLQLAGICPLCTLLPVKAGAEALDRTDDLAQAWLFAADSGADVIVSVTADLGYSTYMEQVIEDVTDRGVVIVEASNDFDSTDHQGGQFHPYVLPGNAVVANSVLAVDSEDAGAPQNAATVTYRARSGFTSWGTQNVFSPATEGGTTSEATPTLGGVLALVLSYGLEAYEDGLIDQPLDGWEAVQVLREASSDIDDPTNPWPNQPGWDLQYGYGRPNVHRALEAISTGDVPPVAIIRSPRWYTLYDPSRDTVVEVTGEVRAPRSSGYEWSLQWAAGPEPLEDEWVTLAVGTGSGSGDVSATLDLSEVPAGHWDRPHELSETKTYETAERNAVTFRLQVTDLDGRLGEDRRAVYTHHDEQWLDGFPLKLAEVGGDSQPVLVDLAGLGRLQIVVPDTDGRVHALDPLAEGGCSGTADAITCELPGWPVHLDPTTVTVDLAGADPRSEPAPIPPAAGDLDGDGTTEVVVTSTTGNVFAFHADGSRVAGWPRSLDTGVDDLPIPRTTTEFARPPAHGAFASPVLWDVDGDHDVEVIQAGWDGHLHVWDGDGSDVPGWPVKVELPEGFTASNGRFVIEDEKLSVTPALADLDGDGQVEIVAKTQFGETRGADLQPSGAGNVMAYHLDGSPVDGWPVTMESIVMFYGSAQEFVTEGVGGVSVADVDGDGADEAITNPLLTYPYVLGDGEIENAYLAAPGVNTDIVPPQQPSVAAAIEGLPADEVIGFTTTGSLGMFEGVLTFAQTGSSAGSIAAGLLATGSGQPILGFERAFDARTGASHPGFPSKYQGLNFLGGPIFVDVTGDGAAEIVDGGDTNTVHAYGSGGAQVEGWPKWHTGWNLWSPSAGDLDSDGDVEIVVATREGYLFVWDTPGDAATGNGEWWSWNHDEWNTGRYGVDSRPPGVVRGATFDPDAAALTFTAPGDDWYVGQAAAYLVTTCVGQDCARREVAAEAAAGEPVDLELAPGTTRVTVQAVDDAGNRGRAVVLSAAAQPDPVAEPPPIPTTGGGAALAAALALLAAAAATARRRSLA